MTPQENVDGSECFCADIGESCDICTPGNVEELNHTAACVWDCRNGQIPDHRPMGTWTHCYCHCHVDALTAEAQRLGMYERTKTVDDLA